MFLLHNKIVNKQKITFKEVNDTYKKREKYY